MEIDEIHVLRIATVDILPCTWSGIAMDWLSKGSKLIITDFFMFISLSQNLSHRGFKIVPLVFKTFRSITLHIE